MNKWENKKEFNTKIHKFLFQMEINLYSLKLTISRANLEFVFLFQYFKNQYIKSGRFVLRMIFKVLF